jgi:hypothetical protein
VSECRRCLPCHVSVNGVLDPGASFGCFLLSFSWETDFLNSPLRCNLIIRDFESINGIFLTNEDSGGLLHCDTV